MIGWIIGDWLNAGEYKLGEMGNVYEEASRTTGLGVGRLQNLKSLAKKVEISRRSEILSIKHHIQIASYSKTPDKQAHWLSQAEKNEWSARQLQQAIKDAETPKYTCADCGYISDKPIALVSDLAAESRRLFCGQTLRLKHTKTLDNGTQMCYYIYIS